jgi:geranylgeranyl pyrophosphate synthase
MSPVAVLTPRADSAHFLDLFEGRLKDCLADLDSEVQTYAVKAALAGGKRIRPLLVYLFSGCNREVSDSVLNASVILELVHLATLIHDDILDGAEIRRKLPSMHQEIGSHAALLLGDALFGYALELASRFPTTKICSIVAEATRKTCSGEIRQTFSRGRTNLSIEEYKGFINDKTGELFKASCEIGAYLSGANDSFIRKAGEFGLSLGINYQIYDDLVDAFQTQERSDKTIGSDWSTGKLTLPMILLYQAASASEITDLDDLLFCKDSQNASDFTRFRLVGLVEKYEILPQCIHYLDESFKRTKSMVDEITDTDIRSQLNQFLNNFTGKFAQVSSLKTSNFLAV